MKKRVKITTLEWALDMIFPCYCRECGKIGSAFCECCIFNNMKVNRPFFERSDKDFHSIFACGIREGLLRDLILEYKYFSRRSLSRAFGLMLTEVIRRFSRGEKYIIVPLPTVSKHIRSRGFDHIGVICRDFAARTGFLVCPALSGVNSAVQVGSTAKKRLEQAKEAYIVNAKAILDKKSHFLLVDDVWTTGASMRAARGVLEDELMRLGARKSEIKISAICLAKNDGYDFS